MSNSFESIAWLKEGLGSAFTEVPVQGDRPLLLDDPSCAYVTLSDHHQLFCVGYEDGAAAGRREHMATCSPGQLLFGLAPKSGPEATALMVAGVTGSVMWRVPTAALFRQVQLQEGQRVIGRLFDAWIELLIRTLPRTPIPTRSRTLSAGETITFESDLPLRAQDELVWIAPRATPKLYRGMDLEVMQAHAECWPIDSSSWVLCGTEQCRVWSSADLLSASGNGEFARDFCNFVLAAVSTRRAELALGRLQSDRSSREAEETLVSLALGQLAAVGRAERLRERVRGDDFEQACQSVAGHLKIPPPRVVKPEGQSLAHMQAALSRTTGMRSRGVMLEGQWFRHDNGPLLGFLLEDGEALRPVALLPNPKGYRVIDPTVDAPLKVDAAVAQRLHPQSYQFYAPLPTHSLGPIDILRFASARARSDVVVALAIGIGTGALGVLIPLLTGQVFDRIIPGAERGLLWQLTWVVLCVYLGETLFDLARGFAVVRAQTRTDVRLEAGVWDRLLSLPLPFFRKYSAGDLAARAAGIGGIRAVLAGATLSILLDGIFSIWNFVYLFFVDWYLAVAATGLVLVSGLVGSVASIYGLRRQRRVAELDGKIGGLLLQILTGIAKLRVTGSENRAFGVWAGLFAWRRDADLQAERVNIRVGIFQASFPLLCSVVLYWLLSGHGGQKLSTGQFLAFNTSFAIFMSAMLGVIDTGLHSLNVIPMYERAKPILTEAVECQGVGDARIVLQGSIELSHVAFRYESHGPLILDDVNFTIEPNEFVAIVGPSGCGKSTLLRILLGFETPSGGGVFYDRQALSALDIRVLRQQIGVVLQHSRVMPGDIFSNIVGNSGLGIDDAWRAAKQAAFESDINAMPMGMHTVISQGGGTLSGGQRQRLLIARALSSRPRILFFDEATSALDNVTQAMVSDSLAALRVTRVVIAHRLSTIQQADKIVVLDRGRIVQIGRFHELMQVDGVFRTLAKRQMVSSS